MRSYIINKNDANQRIDKFLSKVVSRLPSSLLYKYIRLKRIKINGKRCEISTRLNENDVVELYINDEFFNDTVIEQPFLHASSKIDIVYEDDNILLIDKKPGLVVHEDEQQDIDTLINRIKKYLYEKKEYDPQSENSFAPALCNRIDRNTGGIVIAAKNAPALRIVNQKIKDRELTKLYLCIVHGKLSKKSDILSGYLTKDENLNKVFISDNKTKESKTIKTQYKVLKQNNKYSLLEVNLLTGRTHQIRAHFASIGHPLLGDGKYGSNTLNKSSKLKYQALYSYKLTFDFKTDADILNYLNGKTFEVNDVWFKDEFDNIE